MIKNKFTYCDGNTLQTNDLVLVNQNRFARVEQILHPGTSKSIDYGTQGGGFVLVFEDGDVQVWHDTDEDIELIARGSDDGM